MITGTLVASTIINAIFMVALMYLAVEKNRRILHLILLSSGICAISLLSLGAKLWLG